MSGLPILKKGSIREDQGTAFEFIRVGWDQVLHEPSERLLKDLVISLDKDVDWVCFSTTLIFEHLPIVRLAGRAVAVKTAISPVLLCELITLGVTARRQGGVVILN